VGETVAIVDSASTTAQAVRETLQSGGQMRAARETGDQRFLATDGATRFARVGGQFLGHALTFRDVELVDL